MLNLSDNLDVNAALFKDSTDTILLPNYSLKNDSYIGYVASYKPDHILEPGIVGKDMGCGTLLGTFEDKLADLEYTVNNLATHLMGKFSGLGILGEGQHFITFYQVKDSFTDDYEIGKNVVIIHSGKGNLANENGLDIDELKNYQSDVKLAKRNRFKLSEITQEYFKNRITIKLDAPHHFIERDDEKLIYRRGAVKVLPGNRSTICSSMNGDAILVTASDKIKNLNFSLPHATGRKVSKEAARKEEFYLNGDPIGVYLPTTLDAENLNDVLPPNFRSLYDIMGRIEDYISIDVIFSPIASIMI
ncbi:hypothetical protein CL622_07225 [archaeon]|nr:hypothetical protein [archaeon]|tara:strand:+ start:518 stop:1426 length:909 start_codon:yes stop_codon:yes gene_type:complete